MDEARQRAYRVLLSAGLLHIKWDLACWAGGVRLSDFRIQAAQARQAYLRVFAFHNLAVFAASDFRGFSEQQFWDDISRFQRDCPEALCPYRNIFERSLRGEPVEIIAPDGVGGG